MDNQSAIRNPRFAIVGAGPAGTSLAIRLAKAGFETTLIERERFPRQKLCGEFISPECFAHFRMLGVIDQMMDAGGDRIHETRFFERGGRSIAVPTGWFGLGDFALSLSRAQMDSILLAKARAVGVMILESTIVTKLNSLNRRAESIAVRTADAGHRDIEADIFVDGTGRSSVLAKLAEKNGVSQSETSKAGFVGFKTHITGAQIDHGVCEIYSFPGGYAGLLNVEGDLANLCFLVRSEAVRANSSSPDQITQNLVALNARAKESLASFAPQEWLAVSIGSFGKKALAPMKNLFTVGDAAAFIDPFTGSGMVMAFESSLILADALIGNGGSATAVSRIYPESYRRKFTNRLRMCSMLRHAGFMPTLATGVVTILGLSSGPRRLLARATRR